jgi:hypothetical protein
MHAPPCLDQISRDWKRFLSSFPVQSSFQGDKHVPGMFSVYVLKIDLHPKSTWYYIGQSHQKKIEQRLHQHKSEFLNCKTTTRTGKSALYDPKLYDGVTAIILDFEVINGGLTKQQALHLECEECSNYKILHGENFVLTNSSLNLNLLHNKVQTNQPTSLAPQKTEEQFSLPL